MNIFTQLPVIEAIFQNLSIIDWFNCRLVCKKWKWYYDINYKLPKYEMLLGNCNLQDIHKIPNNNDNLYYYFCNKCIKSYEMSSLVVDSYGIVDNKQTYLNLLHYTTIKQDIKKCISTYSTLLGIIKSIHIISTKNTIGYFSIKFCGEIIYENNFNQTEAIVPFLFDLQHTLFFELSFIYNNPNDTHISIYGSLRTCEIYNNSKQIIYQFGSKYVKCIGYSVFPSKEEPVGYRIRRYIE